MSYFRLGTISLLILFAPLLQAQDLTPIGNEFRVNQVTANEQSLAHVASDTAGSYVIVWRSWNQGSTGGSIWARRYGADHVALTPEFVVATGLGSSDRPYVYRWSEGRFVIVWLQGSLTKMRVLAADDGLGDVYDLSIGADFNIDIRHDELLVAYTSNQHIRLRKWDLITNEWMAAPEQASEAPAANYQLPQVRWTSTGGIVAVYRGGSPSPHHIYRKTFNSDLLAQTPEASVYSVNGSLGVINVSINAQDQLLIYARSGVNGTDVFAGRILDADGNQLVASVGSMSAPYAYYYSDCELYDGGAVVLTNNYKTGLSDPQDYCVRANYGLYLGSSFTGFQIASTTSSGVQKFPAVAKLPEGGFIMVWNGNGFQGDADGVYARAFSATDFPTAMTERNAMAVEAWPNPFSDQLFVSVDASTPLEVIDATGRVVHSRRLLPGTTALGLPELRPGAYILRWHAADGTPLVERVVKH
ncbi:MAG: hypothetical protein KF843_03360 [Flavobacteriales bacterium]|nr:hypothetical protein [Flavobacteriales bacterium]